MREWTGQDVTIDRLNSHTEGFSWHTYTLTGHQADNEPVRLAIRREPEDGLLAPYDVEQQYALHREVYASGRVPVPRPIELELRPEFLGMPFYAMELLDGVVPVPWNPDDPRAFPDTQARHRIGRQFVEILARVHEIRWQGTALEGLSQARTSDDAALEQLEHWERYYSRAVLVELPYLRRAIAWLRRNVVTSGRLGLVHGDFRLGNFMVADGAINAVFDWELTHLSDPVEDIAYCGLRLFRGRSSKLSNLLEKEEFFTRYEELTGLVVDPDVFRWWTVLSYVKASASHIRATQAFRSGATDDLRLAAMGHQVHHVLRGLLAESIV